MTPKPFQTKANRIQQIEMLLLSHPEGLTAAEIAKRFEVNRSTIHRYLEDLPKEIYLDGRLWKVDRQQLEIQVQFSLNEALAVHLAARLLANNIDRQNPHAASALRKLGVALEDLAPMISDHIKKSADEIDEEVQRNDPAYLNNLETLTLAWAQGNRVSLRHFNSNGSISPAYEFCPYYIEPSAVGRSAYVFGWSETHQSMRTFKIERLERVELLDIPYCLPPDFNPQDLLTYAWGIWYTDEEPVDVVLKFSERVAHRLGETRWHRTEQVTKLSDGSLLWRAKIAEPQEMEHWIRGWGSAVEVLEPPELREKIRTDAIETARIYGFSSAQE